MRMSSSPSRLLEQHRLIAQSHYRNSISPNISQSTYNSEDEDRHSEHSGSGNLTSAQQAVVNNLLGNTNHHSSSNLSASVCNNQGSNNQFPFTMNGTNNQTNLQQAVASQAANAAAAQIVRKLQQHQNNQLNNSNGSNGPNSTALAAAAAQLSQLTNAANASNAFSNYSAFYNAALNSGADLPLLNNIANSLANVKNNVNNSHSLANVLNNSNGQTNNSNGSTPQSTYIATNQYTTITYKGQQVSAFYAANKNPVEHLLCLPQAFELFLKHLVGGLHTVYTKLKVIFC